MNSSTNITFYLNFQRIQVDFPGTDLLPTTTVLQYLRNKTKYHGAKEGCAEGDCGACTVVIAELVEQKLQYKAFDSCLIFLPFLNGKHLITVEALAGKQNLHPVQQAMVDFNGSQCGYCTPGIVMSMFALYKNEQKPSRQIAEDYLTGNLCRCTGYQPILDAAMKVCENQVPDQFTENEPEMIKQLQDIQQKQESFIYESKLQKYFKPTTLNDALKLKAQHPDAILINGSTDIALRVTKKHETISEIIDLSDIAEMKQILLTESKIVFGAGVTIEQVKKLSEEKFPALSEMLAVFGSRQIRNIATIGGNIGSASPIGDTIPVLMAYYAKLILQNKSGSREVNLKNFITGYHTTVLQKDELIKSIEISFVSDDSIIKSYKISKRKDLDISTVSVCFRLKMSEQKTIENFEAFYGGMSAFTKPASQTTQSLIGKTWTRENVEQAMILIDNDYSPIDDARSSATGRSLMAKNLLLKFWNETNSLYNI